MSESTEAKIARIDERTAILVQSQDDLKEWMMSQDKRICALEACQNKWFGRETAVAVGCSVIISLLTVGTAVYSIIPK